MCCISLCISSDLAYEWDLSLDLVVFQQTSMEQSNKIVDHGIERITLIHASLCL